jgi:hypothetical protein
MILVGLLIILYLINKKQGILRSKEKFQQKCNLLSDRTNICDNIKIKTVIGDNELMVTDKKIENDFIPGIGSGNQYTIMTMVDNNGIRRINISDIVSGLNLSTSSTQDEPGRLIFTNRNLDTNMFRYVAYDEVTFLIYDIYDNYIRVENNSLVLTKNVLDASAFYIA